MTVVAHENPVSQFWEWLGWRSRKISEHRTAAREVRTTAEQRLQVVQKKVQESDEVASWLHDRYRQNHIAEALRTSLGEPRHGGIEDGLGDSR